MALEIKYKCNKCGKEMDEYDKSLGFNFSAKLGYGSKYDGEYVRVDLCCDCADIRIDSCAIDPIEEYRPKQALEAF